MSNNRWPTPARFPALPAGSDISSTVSSAQPFLQNPPQPARHPQPQPHPPTSSNVQYRTPSRLHSQNAPQVNRSTETGKVPVLRPTGVRPYMNPSQAHSPQKRHQNPVNAGIVPHQPAYPARSPPAQSSAAQQPQTGIIPYQSHMPVPYMPPLSGFPGGVVPMPPSFPSNPMYPAPYPYPYPAQPYYDPAFQPPYPSQPETPAAKVQRDFRTAIDSLPGMPYTRGKMAPAITARWVTDGTNFQLIPPSRMIHIPSEEDENPFPELKQPPPEILPRSTSSYVLQPGQPRVSS